MMFTTQTLFRGAGGGDRRLNVMHGAWLRDIDGSIFEAMKFADVSSDEGGAFPSSPTFVPRKECKLAR